MFRRSHKKSKGGCSQCKGRHVKCDESRPSCKLCAISGHKCSFLSEGTASDDLERQHDFTVVADPDHQSDGSSSAPREHLVASAKGPDWVLATSLRLGSSRTTDSQPVNIEHMELLLHLVNGDMNILGGSVGNNSENMMFAVRTGLQYPYLLHELLAFSARHLACFGPRRAPEYYDLAMKLQTQAVSTFNATQAEVNASNCVAILLFASILGHHVLTDTLNSSQLHNIEGLAESFVQCMKVHRGIHTIATSAWPLLVSTEIGPTISWSANFTSQTPRGYHCAPLDTMVTKAEVLTTAERSALYTAIKYLQIGFDAAFDDAEVDQGKKHQMIYSWPMLAAPEYSALLKNHRGEALVILAWYATLLHFGRTMWQVGDAGMRILKLVVDHMGDYWQAELQYAIDQVPQQ